MAAVVQRRDSEADAARQGRAHIGCSGWQYKSWRGPFYPRSLPASCWLRFYATRFDTVEVNNTFYRLPAKPTFAAWRENTPSGFIVCVKASRYLTHLRRLRQPGPPLERLFRRLSALGPRLGPILYQLPATLRYDQVRLQRFVRALRVSSRRLQLGPLRHVIEFRDNSWYREDVFQALASAQVAVCLHDMPGSELDTAPDLPFVYVRFHGTAGKYQGTYSDATLRRWGGRLTQALRQGRDAYAYFNNDLGGTAVENALSLRRYVGQA